MTKRTKKERKTESETQVRKQEKEKNCHRYTAWNVNKKGKLMRGAA